MKVFIIYNRRDSMIAMDVCDTLNSLGFSVWFDFPVFDVDSYEETISRYMKAAQLLVAIWTPDTTDRRQRDWEVARRLGKRILLLSVGDAQPDSIPAFCEVVPCGSSAEVPSSLRAFLSSNVMHAIFVSYATEDVEAANEVHFLISASRHRVWLDRSSLEPGVDFPNEIAAAIDGCTYVFLLWSKSASESPWVKKEWTYAHSKTKEVIPILLDDTPLPSGLRHVNGFRGTSATGMRDFLGIAKAD